MRIMSEQSTPRSKKRYCRGTTRAPLEPLDPRILFDISDILISDDLGTWASAPAITVDAGQPAPGASWLEPAAIRSFYGLNNITFDNGAIVGDGRGQDIAIIDWGHYPNLASDIDHFDQQFGTNGSTPTLYDQYGAAATFLTVYAQNGTGSYELATTPGITLPPNAISSGYGTDFEISSDVEWAHALAPAASITLVEAHDANGTTNSISNAISFAKSLPGVSVVSMSFGANDDGLSYSDSLVSQPGVTFVASSGDFGSYGNPPTLSADSYTSNSWTGTGLAGTSDSFSSADAGYYNQNFFFTTQIKAGTDGNQAGISIRNGTDGSDDTAGSQVENVSLLFRNGTTGILQDRTSNAGTTNTISTFSAAAGVYLGVRRQGTTFYAYESADGTAWTLINSVTVPNINGNVTIDLVGAGSTTNTFNFGNILLYGATDAAESPATSSNALAVGGTVVTTNGAGVITGETTAWGTSHSYLPDNLTLSDLGANAGLGSGGGYSSFETRPSYQAGLSGLVANGLRAAPDVSFVGGTPVAIYDSLNASPGWDGWIGTSFSAPAWAALTAIIDQGRALVGLPSLTSSQNLVQGVPSIQTLLYALNSTTNADFNDITLGSNGAYSAGTGYDLITGLGTPKAQQLAADLSSWVVNSGFETGSITSPTVATTTLGWTLASGSASTIDSGLSHSGTYAAKLGSTASASTLTQTISGLLPDTTYQLSAWERTDGTSSAPARLSILPSGASEIDALYANATTYSEQTILFTTGPSTASTVSATISLSRDAGSGFVYFDDINLQQLSPSDNFGFETGSTNGWTTGSATVDSGSAHSGTYALRLAGSGAFAFQVINNLRPNTTYIVSGYGTADSGSTLHLIAQSYDSQGPQLFTTFTGSGYNQQSIIFTTGPASTSVSIELFQQSGTGNTYIDDINLQLLSSVDNLGFEAGSLSTWTVFGTGSGSSTLISTANSGSFALQLSDTSTSAYYAVSQTITGLHSGTTYTVSAYGKVDTGDLGFLTVSAGGFPATGAVQFLNTSYSQEAFSFTTGTASTSATLTLGCDANTSATANAYFDDISLLQDVLFNAGGNVSITQSSGVISITSGTVSTSYSVSSLSIPRVRTIATGSANDTITFNSTSGGTVTIPCGLAITGTGSDSLVVHGSVSLAGAGTIRVSSLSIDHTGSGTISNYSGAQFDIGNNRIIIETNSSNKSSTISDLNIAISAASGSAASWTNSGLTSSVAINDPGHYGLGVYDDSILLRSSFGTQLVDNNSILLTAAHLGDANFDGITDLGDLSVVTNNWQKAANNWSAGDLSRDNGDDIQDLSIVTNQWQKTSYYTERNVLVNSTINPTALSAALAVAFQSVNFEPATDLNIDTTATPTGPMVPVTLTWTNNDPYATELFIEIREDDNAAGTNFFTLLTLTPDGEGNLPTSATFDVPTGADFDVRIRGRTSDDTGDLQDLSESLAFASPGFPNNATTSISAALAGPFTWGGQSVDVTWDATGDPWVDDGHTPYTPPFTLYAKSDSAPLARWVNISATSYGTGNNIDSSISPGNWDLGPVYTILAAAGGTGGSIQLAAVFADGTVSTTTLDTPAVALGSGTLTYSSGQITWTPPDGEVAAIDLPYEGTFSADDGSDYTFSYDNTGAAHTFDRKGYVVISAWNDRGGVAATWFDLSQAVGPASVQATAVYGQGVRIAWEDDADNETGYEIQRSTDDTTWSTLTTTAADTTSFLDTTATTGTYYYRIRAIRDDSTLDSAFTTPVSVSL